MVRHRHRVSLVPRLPAIACDVALCLRGVELREDRASKINMEADAD